MPRLSVCIPTFNCARYLSDAIRSVLNQGYQDYELIIIDNCSEDNTLELVKRFKSLDLGRIRFFRNKENLGLPGNLNRCLDVALGEYIKFLCADDILLPGCLERMVEVLDRANDITLVASSRLIVDQTGQKLAVRSFSRNDLTISGIQVIKDCLFGSHYIGEPSAVMFRRKDVESGFRPDMPQVLDIDMWFRLLERGNLFYFGDALSAIRQHPAQMTHNNIKSGTLIEDNIKLFEAYAKKPYMKITPKLMLKHKLYMSYRVWSLREYLSNERRVEVLQAYGNRAAYFLMPLLARFVGLYRKLA